MKLRNSFFYESNAMHGWCDDILDIVKMCEYQIAPSSGAFRNVDEFLDGSQQISQSHIDSRRKLRNPGDHPELEFGTRIEHRGKKTLRMYLEEIGVLEYFLKAQKNPKAYKLNNKLKKIKA